VAIVLVASAGGCTANKKGIIADLPEPVFSSTQPAPAIATIPIVPVTTHQQAPDITPTPPPRNTRWDPPGALSRRWQCIVIHHSAGNAGGAASFDRAHRAKGWDELGYHFVIGNGSDTPDGRVEVGSRWYKQKHGAHCKTPNNHYNEHGIGICLVGNFERSSPTPRQWQSLEELLAYLMESCQISPTQIYTHGGVTGRTACPGRNFSLWRLKQSLTSMAASGMYR
jgi:hypothetical protein